MSHGTVSTYTNKKCRCAPCKEAMRLYQLDLQQRKSVGAPVKSLKKTYVVDEEKWWKRHLEKTYGLSYEQFELLWKSQKGACAICQTELSGATERGRRRVRVDHDHVTGAVRGLLCNHCNTGLGAFKDDADNLRAAADYLGG